MGKKVLAFNRKGWQKKARKLFSPNAADKNNNQYLDCAPYGYYAESVVLTEFFFFLAFGE